ncbi:MAG TPA: hypothetical protein PLB25_01080 [Rhodoferax sp.]|nr:hypothetical protein [Rhodoferax sp.]
MFNSSHSIRLILASTLTAVLMAACGGGGDPAPPPAAGLQLDPGDGRVTISWVAAPGVEYWLGYQAAATVSLAPGTPHTWVINVTSPYVLPGLTNGTTYAFSMNGRTDGGPGGAATPSVATVPRPGGESWTIGSTLGTSAIRSVAYGTASDSTVDYVAVGDAGAIYKGTDGINWSAVSTGPKVDFRAATYALSKFIAAGAGGQIYYSTDIATWTAGVSGTSNNLNALASNGTLVVAVGDNGTIRYSSDGATWTAAASVPSSSHLNGITYAASGLWLAVGANGTVLTSSDGMTWTAQISGTSQALTGVATQFTSVYTYVAVGAAGTVLRSNDGITWSIAALSPAVNLTGIVVPSTNSQFLAIGEAGAVRTSPDGITWTARSTTTTANLWGLITAQVQYVAVGDAGITISSH